MMFRLLALGISLVAIVGCGTFRTTVTPRTALEQALLSHSVHTTLESMNLPDLRNKTYTLDPTWVQAVDEEFILTSINEKLLESGLRAAADPAKAEITIFPRIAFMGIDDSSFLLGVPALEVPVPFSGGSFETPELALFKLARQYGRNGMGIYGIERESGELAFSVPISTSQSYHKLWTILFLISFDTSNLPPPYTGSEG